MSIIKFFASFILVFLSTYSMFSQLSKFEENFLRNNDPQGFSYYKFSQGIENQGKRIASSLTNQLTNYQSLIDSENPEAILSDFENKMQNIQSLQIDYNKSVDKYSFNTGQQIGNSINNKDVMGAISGLSGFFNQQSAQKEAQRRAELQKAALNQQRLEKMSQVYWKADKFNEDKQNEYLSRAAYAKTLKEEKYNLEFVKNLECFRKSMKSTFSSINTNWLKNKCPKPTEIQINNIENTFVAKDIQLRNIAVRKYNYFKESNISVFKTAAISYAASAANAKPSAANFMILGEFNSDENPIIGLSALLTAQKINPNYKKSELSSLIDKTKLAVEKEIKEALKNNNVAYLKSFLNAGLDKLIKVNGNSILIEAISIDSPDAVQTMLNSYIEGLDEKQRNLKLQKVIMLCALKNSAKTIQRFIELGVNIDFSYNKFTPVTLANKVNSKEVLFFLLQNTNQREDYNSITENSFEYKWGEFTKLCDNEKFDEAANVYNNLNQNVIDKINTSMVLYFYQNPSALQILNNIPKYKNNIIQSKSLYNDYENLFLYLFFYSIDGSYLDLLKSGVIDFFQIDFEKVTLEKIKIDGGKNINLSKNEELTWQDVFIINQTFDYFFFETGTYKHQYVKYGALWDEKKEGQEDLFNALLSLKSKAYWTLDDKRKSSILIYAKKFKAMYNENIIIDFGKQGRGVKTYLKGYKYYHKDDYTRNNKNNLIDFPVHFSDLLKKQEKTSLLKYAILKKDNLLLNYLNENYKIDWNLNVDSEPLFLTLAKTMNWSFLNNIYTDKLDILKSDKLGNTIFHYLAEHYWIYTNSTNKQIKWYTPDYYLPKLFEKTFDKKILSQKNNLGKTPYDYFADTRRNDKGILGTSKWNKEYKNKIGTIFKQ